jgi:hypothetical protein
MLSDARIDEINPYTLGPGSETDLLLHKRFFAGRGSSENVPSYTTDESASERLRARLKAVYGHPIVVGQTRMKSRRFFARYDSDPSTSTEVLAPSIPLAICRLAVLLMRRD